MWKRNGNGSFRHFSAVEWARDFSKRRYLCSEVCNEFIEGKTQENRATRWKWRCLSVECLVQSPVITFKEYIHEKEEKRGLKRESQNCIMLIWFYKDEIFCSLYNRKESLNVSIIHFAGLVLDLIFKITKKNCKCAYHLIQPKYKLKT